MMIMIIHASQPLVINKETQTATPTKTLNAGEAGGSKACRPSSYSLLPMIAVSIHPA